MGYYKEVEEAVSVEETANAQNHYGLILADSPCRPPHTMRQYKGKDKGPGLVPAKFGTCIDCRRPCWQEPCER